MSDFDLVLICDMSLPSGRSGLYFCLIEAGFCSHTFTLFLSSDPLDSSTYYIILTPASIIKEQCIHCVYMHTLN